MALVPWAGIGAVEVQKLVACGEGAGEDVGGESVPVTDGGNEGVDGVRPNDANERGLTCSNQTLTRNHEALLLVVESGGTDGVRTSYVVAVVCDQRCSHLLAPTLSVVPVPSRLFVLERDLSSISSGETEF